MRANASPSVTIEKGAYYRTKHAHTHSLSDSHINNPYVRRRLQPQARKNTRLVLLLLVLVFACLICFTTAWYLFKTRWERLKHPRPSANPTSLKANAYTYNKYPPSHTLLNTQNKYLSYLPHSGFHNQRIALENALVLARLLNRTLIVPPVRLGNKPVPYHPFDRLSRTLALADKSGLAHCALLPPKVSAPVECLDYFDYTFLSWEYLVNLTSVGAKQIFQYRWNFAEEWYYDVLNLTDANILAFRDQAPYEFRFVDTANKLVKEKNWYSQDIAINDLVQRTEKLLSFGSLFGTTRLRLEDADHLEVRKEIRESMVLSQPDLMQVSESISKALGGNYLAIHFRAGDAKFGDTSESNARTIWWTLVHSLFNITLIETAHLESVLFSSRTLSSSLLSTGFPTLVSQNHYPAFSGAEWISLYSKSSSWSPCRKSRMRGSGSLLSYFNIPLYISTDIKDPRNSPLLQYFRQTFPCTFYLSDFEHLLAPLENIVNEYDGSPLQPHLLPFVDALVAAKAIRVVGTRGSTFSYYIEDVLWTRFHGHTIRQRG